MNMKKQILTLTVLLFAVVISAQTGFNYKALITNSGNVLNTQNLTIRFTILENGTTSVYQETHQTTTDANGIAAVVIGEGTAVSGNFSAIDWGASSYFLKVEVDTGSGFTDFGTSEFKSVPYAKFSQKAHIADYVNHSFWHQNSNGINSPDKVGIGRPVSVDANLHITDITSGEALIKMESDDDVYTVWQSNRSGTHTYMVGVDGGNNNFQISNTTTGDHPFTVKADKVGINNTNPSANLHINGNIAIVDGSQGNNKVLTSDAAGNASWQTPVDNDTHLTEAEVDSYVANNGYLLLDETDATTLELNNNYAGTTSVAKAIDIHMNNSVTKNAIKIYMEGTTLSGGVSSALYVRDEVNSQQNVTGIYQAFAGTNATNSTVIGVRNWFTNSSGYEGSLTGVSNRISSPENGTNKGTNNYLDGTGSGNKYGTYNYISPSAGGNHYAVYGRATKDAPNVYAGFFVGEVNVSNGNLNVVEKLTAPDSGDADMKAYIYGGITNVSANSAAIKLSSSSGFTINKTGVGKCEIHFTDTTVSSYTVVVSASYMPRIFSVSKHTGGGYFEIKSYDLSGNLADVSFDFVVFKK